ncbi:MAG: GIY-YIG nuclease family protein [Candidatus Berkelbacteria bacterium]
MKHYVYMLKSLRSKRFYIGYTIDLERREAEHNAGNTKSTKPFGPWKMIYSEEFASKSEAYRREWHLKHAHGRKEKIDIIKRFGEVA